MKIFILLFLLCFSLQALAEEPRTWHVLIVTSEGKVSLLKSLTKCPNIPENYTEKEIKKMNETWEAWRKKYGDVFGCIKTDGSIRHFQVGLSVAYSGFNYRQVEVFQ